MATNTVPTTNTHTAANNGSGNTSGPYAISFPYLEESDIKVYVGDTLKTQTTHYTFPSATTIQFTSGNHPTLGAVLKFQRDTNITNPKVDFQDGSVLTESDLDNNSKHILYGMQEVKSDSDGLINTFSSSSAPSNPSNGTRWFDTTSGRTYIYYTDTDSSQWVEASPPYDDTSGVTLASKVNFTQSGTGAITRSVESKIKERISVKDFGAKGDGTTDDIVAFNLAKAYIEDDTTETIRELYIPPGKYHLSDIWTAPIHNSYKQCQVMGHGAILTNTVVVGNASCLHGLTVDGSKDAGFVFTRGQWGYHEMLTATNCAHGFYFGVASRQTLTVASVSGFAAGNKVTAGTTNATSEAFGYIDKIVGNKLYLVRCNHNSVARLFRERVARYTQDNSSGDGTGSAGTVVLITYANHGLSNGNSVALKFRTGSSGDNHSANATYTVSSVTTNTFKISSNINALIQGSYDSGDNLGSYVRIIQDETITGDGKYFDTGNAGDTGTANQTTTVSAVDFPYGANSQVTRVTFDNCGAHNISGSGFLIDGSNNGNNRNWFNANTTNGLSLVNCDARSFKVRGYEGGAGGGTGYNYNTHIGMNIEAGAASNSISDSIGRQNTYIGGHFVKTDGGGVSVEMTGDSAFNYIYGGRYIGSVNINGNVQFYHRATGGSYGEINGIQKLTTASVCNFESQGTTFIKEGWSPLPSTYITKNVGSSSTTNHELIIDLSGHSSFTAGNGTDVHSSLINNFHIFRFNIFGVRNQSGFANRLLVFPGVIAVSQENNNYSGYDADLVLAGTAIRISGTPTVAISNSSSFTTTGGASINKAGVIVLTFTTTEEIATWDAIVEYHTYNGISNYSTP
jgi:hypothetical protein